MTHTSLQSIEKLESDLWEAADNLRANSKLTSSEYCMPVLGIIFLRHAANRFEMATRQIAEDQKSGKMPKRKIVAADYVKRRALFLPEEARYDSILATPTDADLSETLIHAMTANGHRAILRAAARRAAQGLRHLRAERAGGPHAHLQPRGAAPCHRRCLRPDL